ICNRDGRQMDGEVELILPSPGRDVLRLRRDVRLAGGTEETVTMRLAFPEAKRWQPWRLGEQPLYRAEVITRTADGVESSRVDDVFAFRELSWDIGPRRWSFSVNGRPMFLRGACYAPSNRLDELTAETFAADIAVAKQANLDALRVVANVLPAGFDRLDPSRPSIAASGDVDLHLMLGWSDGSWRDIGHIEPLMVTAFGSQSLPDVDSPAWEKIGKRWPVADDEPAWRHAGFQPV